MLNMERISWHHVTFLELDMILRLDDSTKSSINNNLSNGITPLSNACKHNREDLVTVLLHYGAESNKSSKSLNKKPLHFACDHSDGNLGIVRKLLDAKAEVNALDDDGNSGLHLACTESNLPVVKLLVEYGADLNIPDIDGETALIRACLANCIELIDFLLKSGSDPNISKGQAMEMAVRISSVESLKLLVEAGAKMDEGDFMHHACEQDHLEMMKLLHNYGVDIHRQNILGMSPLHTSCLNNNTSPTAVQLLLQWGAEVNAMSFMKETPLHYACSSQNLEKIRLLLAYNANVNMCDSHQLSPLLMAFKSPDLTQLSVQILSLLLAAGSQLTTECLSGLKSIISLLPKSLVRQDLLNLLNIRACRPLPLQWLCRFQIRGTVRTNVDENVQTLPLPPQILRFLNFHDIMGEDSNSKF